MRPLFLKITHTRGEMRCGRYLGMLPEFHFVLPAQACCCAAGLQCPVSAPLDIWHRLWRLPLLGRTPAAI